MMCNPAILRDVPYGEIEAVSEELHGIGGNYIGTPPSSKGKAALDLHCYIPDKAERISFKLRYVTSYGASDPCVTTLEAPVAIR